MGGWVSGGCGSDMRPNNETSHMSLSIVEVSPRSVTPGDRKSKALECYPPLSTDTD